jgi:hypothetical protein
MEVYLFKGVALLYTGLIIFGTMIFSNILVVSMILLLKENLIANEESTILPKFLQDATRFVFDFNKLPEVDGDLFEKEVLFTKVS